MADNELQILIRAVDEATSVLKSVENNIKKTNTQMAKSNQKTAKSFDSQTDSLLALGNAANSVDNIFSSYNNLQLRLENASERVAGAQDRLSDAQYNLRKVQTDSSSSAEDLANAQRQVESASRSLTIAQNNQARANEQVIGTYINMGVQSINLMKSLPVLISQVSSLASAAGAFAMTPWGIATIAVGAGLVGAFKLANKEIEETKKQANELKRSLEELGMATKAVQEFPQKEAEAKLSYEIAQKQQQRAELELGLETARQKQGPLMPSGTSEKIAQLDNEIFLLQKRYDLEFNLKKQTEDKKNLLDSLSYENVKKKADMAFIDAINAQSKVIINEKKFADQRELIQTNTITNINSKWTQTFENLPKITEPQIQQVIKQLDMIPSNKTIYINIVPTYGGFGLGGGKK